MENVDSTELHKKTIEAKNKIKEGELELSNTSEIVGENIEALVLEASKEYLAETTQKLGNAMESKDFEVAIDVIFEIDKHLNSLEKGYQISLTEQEDSKNNLSEIEKYKQEMKSVFLEHLDNMEAFDLSEFVGEHDITLKENFKKKYGEDRVIPGDSYQNYFSKYFTENPEKISEILSPDTWYYFLGTLDSKKSVPSFVYHKGDKKLAWFGWAWGGFEGKQNSKGAVGITFNK